MAACRVKEGKEGPVLLKLLSYGNSNKGSVTYLGKVTSNFENVWVIKMLNSYDLKMMLSGLLVLIHR